MTLATAAEASSVETTWRSDAAPGTTIVTSPPICWAAATASHEARLSTPSFCSAMTRILEDTGVLLQRAHEFLRRFRRPAGDHARLLRFLRNIDRRNSLTRRRRRRRRDDLDLFFLGR